VPHVDKRAVTAAIEAAAAAPKLPDLYQCDET